MPNVVCIYAGQQRQPGGCEIYRGNMPLHHLAQSGRWKVIWEFFGNLVEAGLRSSPAQVWGELIAWGDLFVLPRLYLPDDQPEAVRALADLYQAIRLANKRIVYETDDDYTNRYRRVIDGDAIMPAAWADAITVTTPFLGETMRRWTRRPIHILPNCISADDFMAGPAPERQPEMADKTVIALTGSPSHATDWLVLRDVMPRILDEFPDAHFLVMGYHPDYLSGLPRTTYSGAVRYDTYAHTLRGCDIILAPVDPLDRFNLGKSPIKAIEAMAAERKLPDGTSAGAAVLATDNPIYRLAVRDGKTGLLVEHTPDGWLNALRSLLTNPERRKALQTAGIKWAYAHHDIASKWSRWSRAYDAVLRAPPSPVQLPTTPKKGTTS